MCLESTNSQHPPTHHCSWEYSWCSWRHGFPPFSRQAFNKGTYALHSQQSSAGNLCFEWNSWSWARHGGPFPAEERLAFRQGSCLTWSMVRQYRTWNCLLQEPKHLSKVILLRKRDSELRNFLWEQWVHTLSSWDILVTKVSRFPGKCCKC